MYTVMFCSPTTGHVYRRATVTSLDQVRALAARFPRFDIGVCEGTPEKFRAGDPRQRDEQQQREHVRAGRTPYTSIPGPIERRCPRCRR